MSPDHSLTNLLQNPDKPLIFQAPMAGGITTPALVAAVSNAHGVGSYATGYLDAKTVRLQIQQIKQLTSHPFAANVFIPSIPSHDQKKIEGYQTKLNQFRTELGMPPLPPFNSIEWEDHFFEIVEILLAEQVPIVSFAFGRLEKTLIRDFKKANTYLIGTANTPEEVELLLSDSVDAVVVQGNEAGGHRGGFLPASKSLSTLALLSAIPISTLSKFPMIAAGGIMTGKEVFTALSAGAAGVQLGTAFLLTQESGAHPTYKDHLRLKRLEQDPTVVTSAYSGKPARGVKTRFIEQMDDTPIPDYPIAHYLSAPIRKEAAKQGNAELMSIWAGTGVSRMTQDLSVGELLAKIYMEFHESGSAPPYLPRLARGK